MQVLKISKTCYEQDRDQDRDSVVKTQTKTKTWQVKTETKTKTSEVETKTKTKTSKTGLETVSRRDQVSRRHSTVVHQHIQSILDNNILKTKAPDIDKS